MENLVAKTSLGMRMKGSEAAGAADNPTLLLQSLSLSP